MTATDVAVAPAAAVGGRAEDRTSADLAIARRAFKQVWIGATVCAVVFGGTAASSAVSYVATFPTEASRQQVAAATTGDAGLSILLGPINAIDTVGGYTVYKGFVFLTTIGAIWAVLTANRLLRGEEDTGRWQLVLAGSTRASRATAATLAALGGAVVVIFAGTTVLMLLAARDPELGLGTGATVLYGLSIAIPPAVFVAVGALTSQLARSRRSANGLGLVIAGVAFVIRMVADAGPDTAWLRWATPFGWTELVQPYTANDAWPLVPAAVTVVVLGGVAIVLASRRDAGDAVLASNDVTEVRPFGLRTVLGLSLRLELPVLVAWCVGALACGLVLGVIAKMTTADIPASMGDTLENFGVQGSFATQYFGVAFLIVATVVALIPAGQIGAMADEQGSGRLVAILVGPERRASWFAGRLGVAAVAIAAAGLLAGLGSWLGAVSQGVDPGFGAMLGAGLNVVPTALVSLGVGAIVLPFAPRAAGIAVYVLIGWSLIIDLLGSMVTSVSWLTHLSLFNAMALAPAEDPVPSTVAITLVVALGLGAAATAIFQRRDVQTG